MINNKEVNAIITAAGTGTRMKSSVSKQFMMLGKMTVLERTLSKFLKSQYVDRIYIVAKKENFDLIKGLINIDTSKKDLYLVEGGSSREESTYKGICAIESGQNSILLTHDAARPFVTTRAIDEIISQALKSPALIYGVAEIDTVKLVSQARVQKTLDRSQVYRVQTPQCFEYSLLKRAYETSLNDKTMTDDSSYVEKLGQDVKILLGSYDNIKITTKEDLKLATLLAEEEDFENR